jgi:hypothetical protein
MLQVPTLASNVGCLRNSELHRLSFRPRTYILSLNWIEQKHDTRWTWLRIKQEVLGRTPRIPPCRGNVFTELLPSNDRGKTGAQTHASIKSSIVVRIRCSGYVY